MLCNTTDSTGATVFVKQLVGQEERNGLKKDSFPRQRKSHLVSAIAARKKNIPEFTLIQFYRWTDVL